MSRATLRSHGIALAVALWAVFLWSQAVPGPHDRFGTLRGVDFLQFYAAGRAATSRGPQELYDWDAFARELPALTPGVGELLFLPVYPPQVALFFASFAPLSYPWAVALWQLLTVVLYCLAAALLVRSLPPLRPYRLEAAAFAVGFPPFLQLVAHGQVAALAVVPLVLAWRTFARDRMFLTGLAFGTLAFKPQLLTIGLAAFVAVPRMAMLAGLACGVLWQAAIVLVVWGAQPWTQYAGVVKRLAEMPGAFEPKLWQMHSLRGALELLVGQTRWATALWLGGAVIVLWLARRAAAYVTSPELRFAAVIVAGLLLNPHLYVYDLVLLAVPLALAVSWCLEHPGDVATPPIAWLAYALVWLPLIGPLAAISHLQLTAPAMGLLLWRLGRVRSPVVAREPLNAS